MGFAKSSPDRSRAFEYSIELADGEGVVFCDDSVLNPDPGGVFTQVNPGARPGVAGDDGNVLGNVEVRTSGYNVHWSRNQLDLFGLGDDSNVHLLEADEEPLRLSNVSKLAILNDSGNTTTITVSGRLTRRGNRVDSMHPGGLAEAAKPLTIDRTTITIDSTHVTIDQTEYR